MHRLWISSSEEPGVYFVLLSMLVSTEFDCHFHGKEMCVHFTQI